MMVIKEDVYTHRSLKTGVTAYHTGPQGEAPGSFRRQSEEKARVRIFIVIFVGKKEHWQGRTSRVDRLGAS